MKLVKKQGTDASPLNAAMLGATIDRRTFLKRSGITAGGIAAAGTLSMSMMKKAAATDRPPTDEGNPHRYAASAPTVRSVAAFMPRSRTVSGPGRNRPSIIPSTAVRIVPRARRCANMVTANAD